MISHTKTHPVARYMYRHERLRAIRLALGMTQLQFAEALGLPARYGWKQVSHLESGKGSIREATLRTAELLLENAMLRDELADVVHLLDMAHHGKETLYVTP